MAGLAGQGLARGAEQPVTRPGEATLPLVPDAADVHLSEKEAGKLAKGEIVVQTVERTKEDREARAIGYLEHNPAELFGVAGDPTLQTEMYPEIKTFEELERWDSGKRFRAVADVSMFLPNFHYTMTGCWNASKTARCWGQLSGDFDRNDGSQSFLWDASRHETLGVFTFDLALKGILSLVPESLILSLAGNNLPHAMRSLDAEVTKVRERDPARAAQMDRDWAVLEARLTAGELPGRVWPPTAVAPNEEQQR